MAPDPGTAQAPGNERSLAGYHSRYAPLREAERHLESLLAGKQPALIFILGGGLNYLGVAAQKRFPGALTVSLQPCDDFRGHELHCAGLHWSPASSEPLEAILRLAMSSGKMAGGVAIVEWPPLVARFKEASASIRTTLLRLLDEESSNAATSSFWASRWLVNCLRFVRSAEHSRTLAKGSGPIVIACAGPSLADHVSELRAKTGSYCLWSLASAVPALLRAGLKPELAISSDPGYWNVHHLRSVFETGIALAMTPSSYSSAAILEQAPLLALDTGMQFEKTALELSGFYGTTAIASGSAAGTALSLALRATSGPVALAGFDLAARALDDHARPYAFDMLDVLQESRTRPALSANFERVTDRFPLVDGAWRYSRAFSTYAATIAPPRNELQRVLRVGCSPVETALPRGGFDCLGGSRGDFPFIVPAAKTRPLSREERLVAPATMLGRLLSGAEFATRQALSLNAPIPSEESLLLRALAPVSSAPFLASAARGEAREEDFEKVLNDAARAAHLFSGQRT